MEKGGKIQPIPHISNRGLYIKHSSLGTIYYIMIKIDKASKFDEDMVRTGMATIFSDGFTQWLTFFSKDPKKIAAAFKHIFILERFFVAVDDNRVVGMVACTNIRELSVRLNGKKLRKYLGWYKGSLALLFLKKEFEAPLKL